MKQLILMVAPPGAGKSTYAKQFLNTYRYINQDSQGKEEHKVLFKQALEHELSIIVDRMNFSKEQRNRYLIPAKEAGYRTKIIVLHESFDTCLKRCLERKNHETIKSPKDARNALDFFFKKYERVEDNEADEVVRVWPEHRSEYASWTGELVKVPKKLAIICDLDGTLCDIEHRLHFVRGEGKKDWKGFFNAIPGDKVNQWCKELLEKFDKNSDIQIILCSGRPDSHRSQTESWLNGAGIGYDNLFMRNRSDFRSDDIVKEMIYEFEIKSRYEVYFWIDDRQQVVDKIRSHGVTVLQCAPGKF